MSRTVIGERATRFQRAIDAGDGEAAVASARRVADAPTPDSVDLLSDLRDALAAGDDDAARTLIGELDDSYERTDRTEGARTARVATALRTEFDPYSGPGRELAGYMETWGDVGGSRASVLATVPAFLVTDGAAADRSEAIDAVEGALADERTLDRRADRAGPIADAVDVPATIAVLSARPTADLIRSGEEVTVIVRVQNVGDSSTGPVRVTASRPEEEDPLSETSFDPLGAGEQVTWSYTPPIADEPGTETVVFVATTDEAGNDDALATWQVVRTGGELPPPAGRFDEDDDGRISTPELATAIRAWARGDISTEGLATVIRIWAQS